MVEWFCHECTSQTVPCKLSIVGIVFDDPEPICLWMKKRPVWVRKEDSRPTPSPRIVPNESYAKYPPIVNRREDGQLTLTYDYWGLTEHDSAISNATLTEAITQCEWDHPITQEDVWRKLESLRTPKEQP